MAHVEFLMKWYIERSPEEKKYDEDQYLIDSEYQPPSTFVYKNLCLDMDSITNFNKAERDHTYVRTKYDEAFTLKIPYDTFKMIYQERTLIRSFKDYQFINDETEEGREEEL